MANHQLTPSKQADPSSNLASPTQGTKHSSQNIDNKHETTSPSSVICNNLITSESSNTAKSLSGGLRPQHTIHQTTRRSNEISHHNRKLHRHHNRNFSKNNLHRFISFNRRNDSNSTANNDNGATLNRQHLNPMVISLLLCMSLYMVITL